MTDILRVNDSIYSWTSCRFVIIPLVAGVPTAPIPFEGLTAVKYEDAIEMKLVHGMRRNGRPLGTTQGKYVPGLCSISILRDSVDILQTLLSAFGFGSLGDARFHASLTVSEPTVGPLPAPIVTMLETCRITKLTDDQQEGTEELITVAELQPLSVTRGGKRLWSVQRSTP